MAQLLPLNDAPLLFYASIISMQIRRDSFYFSFYLVHFKTPFHRDALEVFPIFLGISYFGSLMALVHIITPFEKVVYIKVSVETNSTN